MNPRKTISPPAEGLPPAIFLMGPTASGKTALAVQLVRHLPCDIISVDSGQVYREMDIGTAKPDPATLAAAPHRLIDIRDPVQAYSAEEFRSDARSEMTDILRAGRIPLLVGGTMLYFRALEHGLSTLPPADPEIRAHLAEQAQKYSWAVLHARLGRVDPAAAARIHPNDAQRIQRALEVFEITATPLSQWHAAEVPRRPPWHFIKLALIPSDRKQLHRRIEHRFRHMLELGLVGEVEVLYARGDLSPEKPSIRTVGYRQVWEYLAGERDYEEMTRRAIFATRQFAKRQLTWLRSEAGLDRFHIEDKDIVDKVLKSLASVPNSL